MINFNLYIIIGISVSVIIITVIRVNNYLNRNSTKKMIRDIESGKFIVSENSLRLYHDLRKKSIGKFPDLDGIRHNINTKVAFGNEFMVRYSKQYEPDKLFLCVEYIDNGIADTKTVSTKKEYHNFSLNYDRVTGEIILRSRLPVPEQFGVYERFADALFASLAWMF